MQSLSQQIKSFSMQTRQLMHEWENLTLHDVGILHSKTAKRTQLVLHAKFKDTVLKALQNEMGNQGTERTPSLVRERLC